MLRGLVRQIAPLAQAVSFCRLLVSRPVTVGACGNMKPSGVIRNRASTLVTAGDTHTNFPGALAPAAFHYIAHIDTSISPVPLHWAQGCARISGSINAQTPDP